MGSLCTHTFVTYNCPFGLSALYVRSDHYHVNFWPSTRSELEGGTSVSDADGVISLEMLVYELLMFTVQVRPSHSKLRAPVTGSLQCNH